MNRLMHLRETLPANIDGNKHHPNVEFVVLDYNSRDGMEDWIRSHMYEYIESGLLKYYKTYDPVHFHMSHSRNMAFRLASGNVICLVDADNYTGAGYAEWVDTIFTGHGTNTIITTISKDHMLGNGDTAGRLCFGREVLYRAKGFDESLVGYGVEDLDLANRLDKAGVQRVYIDRGEFLNYISHSHEERVKNHHLINNLFNIYIEISSTMYKKCRVLYLLRDNSFKELHYEFKGIRQVDLFRAHGGWLAGQDGYASGRFEQTPEGLLLQFENNSTLRLQESKKGLLQGSGTGNSTIWKVISPEDTLYVKLVKSYGECINRIKLWENDKKKYDSVNIEGWGKGTVYLNFDTHTPIHI